MKSSSTFSTGFPRVIRSSVHLLREIARRGGEHTFVPLYRELETGTTQPHPFVTEAENLSYIIVRRSDANRLGSLVSARITLHGSVMLRQLEDARINRRRSLIANLLTTLNIILTIVGILVSYYQCKGG